LTLREHTQSYEELVDAIDRFASGLMTMGVHRSERIAFYLDKSFETVATAFGAVQAGAVLVPINPLLKAEQVAHILRDCNVRLLVTSTERLDAIASVLAACPDLREIVLVGESAGRPCGKEMVKWRALAQHHGRAGHRVIDTDMAAILYTSGSTGKP
jgi:acyl-CoA synthetase (AMP-forming)/AMP-acid ligase II